MTDATRDVWAEKLKEIVGNPNLVDRMGSADLKRVCKLLAQTIMKVGQRAADAECTVGLLQFRVQELTGRRPPEWSYLHKEEVQHLHEFTSFTVEKAEHAYVVCGAEPTENTMHPLYEYDLEDFAEDAESRARVMCAHLRETFLPRTTL